MKVQLQEQTLRLRLDEAELAALQAGQEVGNRTRLVPGAALCVQVRLTRDEAAALVGKPGHFTFFLPQAQLDPYVVRLPCRDGLCFSLPVGGEDRLDIEFEVDVRDSVRQRGVVKPAAPRSG